MSGGRPSKYEPRFSLQVKKLCRLGATNEEIAEFFEVAVSTIHEWRAEYPAFSDALKAGKATADAEVAHKLFRRATGYSHQATKFFMFEGAVITEDFTERYPPDTTACIFWLKNRRPDLWRDKIEHAGDPTKPIILKYSLDEPEEKK
jgi:hypothetical protein